MDNETRGNISDGQRGSGRTSLSIIIFIALLLLAYISWLVISLTNSVDNQLSNIINSLYLMSMSSPAPAEAPREYLFTIIETDLSFTDDGQINAFYRLIPREIGADEKLFVMLPNLEAITEATSEDGFLYRAELIIPVETLSAGVSPIACFQSASGSRTFQFETIGIWNLALELTATLDPNGMLVISLNWPDANTPLTYEHIDAIELVYTSVRTSVGSPSDFYDPYIMTRTSFKEGLADLHNAEYITENHLSRGAIVYSTDISDDIFEQTSPYYVHVRIRIGSLEYAFYYLDTLFGKEPFQSDNISDRISPRIIQN
jgi:hypothetical protein